MPTTRPRYQVTETPTIAAALDRAAQQWPGECRAKLLVRLVEAGSAEPDADQSLRLAILRATSRLKSPDCCVLDAAIHHRADLATFDRALARVGAAHGITVLP